MRGTFRARIVDFFIPRGHKRDFYLQYFKDRGIRKLSKLKVPQLEAKYIEYRKENG